MGDDWTDEVDRLLSQVEGQSDAESARKLDVSESQFRTWRRAREAGERITGKTRGKPRKALLRAREGLVAAQRVSAEVEQAINKYLPDHLRRAFMEANDAKVLRGLHIVLTAIPDIDAEAVRVISGDLDRRIREAEAEH